MKMAQRVGWLPVRHIYRNEESGVYIHKNEKGLIYEYFRDVLQNFYIIYNHETR